MYSHRRLYHIAAHADRRRDAAQRMTCSKSSRPRYRVRIVVVAGVAAGAAVAIEVTAVITDQLNAAEHASRRGRRCLSLAVISVAVSAVSGAVSSALDVADMLDVDRPTHAFILLLCKRRPSSFAMHGLPTCFHMCSWSSPERATRLWSSPSRRLLAGCGWEEEMRP